MIVLISKYSILGAAKQAAAPQSNLFEKRLRRGILRFTQDEVGIHEDGSGPRLLLPRLSPKF